MWYGIESIAKETDECYQLWCTAADRNFHCPVVAVSWTPLHIFSSVVCLLRTSFDECLLCNSAAHVCICNLCQRTRNLLLLACCCGRSRGGRASSRDLYWRLQDSPVSEIRSMNISIVGSRSSRSNWHRNFGASSFVYVHQSS